MMMLINLGYAKCLFNSTFTEHFTYLIKSLNTVKLNYLMKLTEARDNKNLI